MSISHAYTENSSQTSEIFSILSESFSFITDQIKVKDFAQLEKELHQKYAQARKRSNETIARKL